MKAVLNFCKKKKLQFVAGNISISKKIFKENFPGIKLSEF